MRIASLSPAVTEILFALGRGGDIVCTDQFSNFPPEAKELPHLKGHAEVDAEELARYGPDFVCTSTVVQSVLAQHLKAAGFEVVHQDPRTVHAIYESIRSLGAVLTEGEAAQQLITRMQQGLNDVRRRAQHLPERLPVYVEEWHDPPYASGNWVPEVVRMAGGAPFPLGDGELSRAVTLEEIQQHDPALIVISWCGAGSFADPQLLTQREEWDALRAVRNGNIRVIDDSLLNRPGPRLIEGAGRVYGWLFEQLH